MNSFTQKKNKILLRKKNLPMFDVPFLAVTLILLAIGLAMLFSAGYADALESYKDSYHYISRQLLFAAIGLVGMLILSFTSYKFYRRLAWIFYFLCVILLIAVLIFGKGAQKRWLNIGGFQFQPSEFAKVSVVLVLADYISRNRDKMGKFVSGIIIPLIILGVPTVLVLVETHLSGAILIASIGIAMMIAGGCKIRQLLIPAGGLGAIVMFAIMSVEYIRERIVSFIEGNSDVLGAGYQVNQSLISIGSGGLFGLGYGKSRQKYYFMPEPQNDFIFSIVCEELGWIGAVVILSLFAFLIWRGIRIALHAPNTFTSLVVVGIITKLAVQVIFNVAVVTGSVPATGISLPFFSYGGTALVVLLAEIGLILYISRFAVYKQDSDKEETDENIVNEETEVTKSFSEENI